MKHTQYFAKCCPFPRTEEFPTLMIRKNMPIVRLSESIGIAAYLDQRESPYTWVVFFSQRLT